MVSKLRLYKSLAWLCFALSCPAFAAETGAAKPAGLHFVGRYYITWGGLNLAAAELQLDVAESSYTVRLAARSAGVVNWFTHHRSDTSAHGRRNGDAYYPELYESRYWTKNKPRHIKIAFDPKGAVTEDIVEPPEDPKERPVVPHALKDGALDPLTLIPVLATSADKPRVYDAKQLYDGKVARGAATSIRTYSGARDALPLTISRTAISGMTAKEIKEYAKGEPSLTLYLSSDGKAIPLYFTLPISVGWVKGSLVQECATWDECKIEP